MTPLILIVDDQPEIGEILAAYLEKCGFRTAFATDGQQALDMHSTLHPALMLLDVQMPRVDGWQVLATVRTRGDTPVIMLTAMDQDLDKLTGLRIGADDYVVKPFNPAEVVARVEAVLRRTGRQSTSAASVAPDESGPLLRAGPFEIDVGQHQACAVLDGRRVDLDLTPTEFKLLAELARAPRRVLSRERLLDTCLPEGDSMERTVDSHISKLRRKLEDLGITGTPVTVRGLGYKLGQET